MKNNAVYELEGKYCKKVGEELESFFKALYSTYEWKTHPLRRVLTAEYYRNRSEMIKALRYWVGKTRLSYSFTPQKDVMIVDFQSVRKVQYDFERFMTTRLENHIYE